MTTLGPLAMVMLVMLVLVVVVCVFIWAGEAGIVMCLGTSSLGVTLLLVVFCSVVYPLFKGK